MLGEITNDVLNASVEYREDGRLKKATRHELTLKALVKQALGGNVSAAEMLLKLWTSAQTGGAASNES